MPSAFSSPGTEPLYSPPSATPIDVWAPVRALAFERVLADPELEPHVLALLGDAEDHDDLLHLTWVIRARTAKLVEWAEAGSGP